MDVLRDPIWNKKTDFVREPFVGHVRSQVGQAQLWQVTFKAPN